MHADASTSESRESSGMLCLLDYDGTLARENEPVDLRILEKLSRIKEAHNLRLVIVTARPLQNILGFISRVEIFDAFVLELGSTLYLLERNCLVLFKPVYWDDVLSAAGERLPAANKGFVLYYVDEDYYEEARAFTNEIAGKYSAELVKVGSRTYAITPPGVDKKLGVERLLAVSGWRPRSKVAVGDSPSDLPLFEVSDTKVAVGNAHPELKAKADFIAKSEYGEGVLEGILWFLEKVKTG
uniref:HAD family phosphatase n=1 Tax=Thermofilum pendens TaxID=2269 RepID=A0A7J3X716_THEPE